MHGTTKIETRTKYLYRKTVKGNPYLYFRMKDGSLVALPLDESSAEFKRCYDECFKSRSGKISPPPASPSPTKHIPFIGSTFGKAVEVYKRSPEWLDLRSSSKRQYAPALDVMLEKLADVELKGFDLESVNRYSAQITVPETLKRLVRGTMKRFRRGGPAAADTHVFLLSNIWQVCRDHAEFGIANIPNPTLDAKRRKTKTKHEAAPWNEDQQDRFIETAPDYLVLGYHLLRYFGQRGGDCVKLLWSDFVEKRIEDESVYGLMVAPEKGNDLEPEFCQIPDILVDALKHAQQTCGDAPTILTNNWGKPWSSASGLSAAIRNHLIEIGLAKRGTKTISMHGLRKNAAIMGADTDFGTAGVKSITLHKSDSLADYYAKRRDRARLRVKVIERINVMEAEKADAKTSRRRPSLTVVK